MNEQSPRFKTFSMDDLKAAIDNPAGKQVIINGFTEEESRQAAKVELTDAQANFRVILFVIVFLGGIIAAIVFSQTEPLLSFATIGAIFLVLGLISLFQSGFDIDSPPALIMPAVGALMTGIPLIILYHRTHPDSLEITRDGVFNIILGAMALLGAFMLVIPLSRHKIKMKACTQTIMAKCIYLDIHFATRHNARGVTINYNVYAPTWQYEIGDFLYVTREPIFTTYKVPEIGEMREIRYNPADPSYIYRPVLRNEYIEMAIGAGFFLAGLGTAMNLKQRPGNGSRNGCEFFLTFPTRRRDGI